MLKDVEVEKQIDNRVVDFMSIDQRREYTIPEIMAGVGIKSRENTAAILARLEGRGIVELSRQKGRTKYFRLKERD
jgi:hypothetical protein